MNRWYRNTLRIIQSAGQTFARARRRRAAIRELRALDPRMLIDIGLHRSDLRMVVEELLSTASQPRATATSATATSSSESGIRMAHRSGNKYRSAA